MDVLGGAQSYRMIMVCLLGVCILLNSREIIAILKDEYIIVQY